MGKDQRKDATILLRISFQTDVKSTVQRKDAKAQRRNEKVEFYRPFVERSSTPRGKEIFFKKAKKLQESRLSTCFLKKDFLPWGMLRKKGDLCASVSRDSPQRSGKSIPLSTKLCLLSFASLRLCAFAFNLLLVFS